MNLKIFFFRAKWCLTLSLSALLLMVSVGKLDSQSLIDNTIPLSDGTLRRIRVPILMYHYVSQLPPDADAIRTALTIAPEMFRAHLRYLKDQGYHATSLYELDDALMRGALLPPNPIILTFDDSYLDHYLRVFPALQEQGFVGTFFVITGKPDAGDPAYLGWNHIQEMAAAGMSMESHTRSHLDLRSRNYNFLIYELLGSLESLAAHTGREPRMFAYPVGRYDDMTLKVLSQLPIWRAVTTQPGALHTTDNRLELPRVRISGDTTVAGLAALLHTA